MTAIAHTPAATSVGPRRLTEAGVVTVLIVAFLAWMPLQTPTALVVYQYLHFSDNPIPLAQAVLLFKDFWAAALIAVLFVRHFREIRFLWFDWCALAFGVLVAVYSVVPAALGSHLPAFAVIASARELLVPVELYGLGRLAGYAGVSAMTVIKAFLVIAAGAAVFSVGTFMLWPQTVWITSYNIVQFIHDVQGIGTATDLWNTSIVSIYAGHGSILRAIGPFVHPVGTGVYFAMPLTLAMCAAWLSNVHQKVSLALVLAGLVLFALAVVTPISRGTWIGFLGSVVICGVVLRKFRLAALTVVLFAVFIAYVPPFSFSVETAIAGTDSSTIAHNAAIDHGVQVITSDPLGGKVGGNDQYGAQIASAAGVNTEGVGENMYLTTYASVGPFGLLAFVIWLGAVTLDLLRRKRPSVPAWISVGVGTGLLAEAAAGMTASTLMRFTTAASMALVVGLIVAQSTAGNRGPDVDDLRHPRRWLGRRRGRAEAVVAVAAPDRDAI